jgi:hypothetical protein
MLNGWAVGADVRKSAGYGQNAQMVVEYHHYPLEPVGLRSQGRRPDKACSGGLDIHSF